MADLASKTALVAGGTSGIAKVSALARAAAGVAVAATDRDELKGKAVGDAFRAGGGSAVFLAADLVREGAVT